VCLRCLSVIRRDQRRCEKTSFDLWAENGFIVFDLTPLCVRDTELQSSKRWKVECISLRQGVSDWFLTHTANASRAQINGIICVCAPVGHNVISNVSGNCKWYDQHCELYLTGALCGVQYSRCTDRVSGTRNSLDV